MDSDRIDMQKKVIFLFSAVMRKTGMIHLLFLLKQFLNLTLNFIFSWNNVQKIIYYHLKTEAGSEGTDGGV